MVMGVFLFFGATMAALAGVTLLWRGTVLDQAWVLNPVAFKELGGYGRGIGIPFLLLSGALVLARVDWNRRRFWGWLLAVVIISAQVLGNLLMPGWAISRRERQGQQSPACCCFTSCCRGSEVPSTRTKTWRRVQFEEFHGSAAHTAERFCDIYTWNKTRCGALVLVLAPQPSGDCLDSHIEASPYE